MMFGYWAAMWVHLNKVGGFHRNNPFTGLVVSAGITRKEKYKNG